MCGIAGIVSNQKLDSSNTVTIRAMADRLAHRGPDDKGYFESDHCMLGHRRLAIIDLSSDGHQPFLSDDKRYVCVYNGELFNYIELRDELKACGWTFQTQSDTEVLLKAYQQYGAQCLSRFNGMFAFAIWDTRTQQLFCGRDRFGIKPFYYVIHDGNFYFASEIKAFKEIRNFSWKANQHSIFDYLVFHRTDVFDETFVDGIKRIPKGHYGVWHKDQFTLTQWWAAQDFVDVHKNDDWSTVTNRIHDFFQSSLTWRMRSDVSVGSCLSGGLDSSILCGALFDFGLAKQNYRTFTVSFPNDSIDETKYVDDLNKKYDFLNHRITPTSDEALGDLKEFVYTQDEPTTAASFYAQYALMRLAKSQGVTVLLDGQGGDEIFAGYHYFYGFYADSLWQQRKYFKSLGVLASMMINGVDQSAWETFVFQRLSKSARQTMLFKTVPHLQKDFFQQSIQSSRIFNQFFDTKSLNQSLARHFEYKLEHLLRTEDRTSMHFSIEARLPYLDYRLVECLLATNENFKISQGQTKFIQRQALGKYTHQNILHRKDKLGFETPQDKWMQEPTWEALAQENFNKLKEVFPDVFVSSAALPASGRERWKIIQLGIWIDIFLN